MDIIGVWEIEQKLNNSIFLHEILMCKTRKCVYVKVRFLRYQNDSNIILNEFEEILYDIV